MMVPAKTPSFCPPVLGAQAVQMLLAPGDVRLPAVTLGHGFSTSALLSN